MSNRKTLPKHAWVNCREIDPDLLFLGEVLSTEENIFEKPGNIKPNKFVGKIHHGTMVNVLDKKLDKKSKIIYYKISTDKLKGWISESLLAWQWSSFTFIGNFQPAEVCKSLDLSLNYMGASILIRDNGFAVITDGDPDHFEIIRNAVTGLINRIINAQAPLTQISLQAEFSNWVEVPIGENENRSKSVGFLIDSKNEKTISNSNIQDAYSILPLMELSPYFDLALSDFHQALQYPQHALIFLSRAIESIENHFGRMKKQNKGKGKEEIMRQKLRVNKSDVEYITKRANASHRRHASRDASIESLSNEELAECFYKTANIIAAFADYFKPAGFDEL
ncbi:MAG: hypothetical protein HYZ21_08485 [Chloroflexi bacterium]|nr:hypothetical protein [Chloroflexota bacterium]